MSRTREERLTRLVVRLHRLAKQSVAKEGHLWGFMVYRRLHQIVIILCERRGITDTERQQQVFRTLWRLFVRYRAP